MQELLISHDLGCFTRGSKPVTIITITSHSLVTGANRLSSLKGRCAKGVHIYQSTLQH